MFILSAMSCSLFIHKINVIFFIESSHINFYNLKYFSTLMHMCIEAVLIYCKYTCCIYFIEIVPGPPGNLTVQVLNFAVTLSWQPPLLTNGIIIFYTITFNGSRDETQPVSYEVI